MPKITKPTLTNRGGYGLLNKLTPEQKAGIVPEPTPENVPKHTRAVAKHRITPALQQLAVSIDVLTPDPNNARVHGERNMEAIKHSLTLYGQVKPIVVNRDTNIVLAGNGTLQAAKELGWDTIAVSYVDMNEGEAAAYGMADNRTAELASWDTECIKRLDALIQSFGGEMVGWTTDQLEIIRMAQWVAPTPNDATTFGNPGKSTEEGDTDDNINSEPSPLTVKFETSEYDVVAAAVTRMREIQESSETTQATCIRLICQEWLEVNKAEEADTEEENNE